MKFVHALEDRPEDPVNFTGNTERDVRVRWLVGDPPGTGPWKHSPNLSTPNEIVLVRSGLPAIPKYIEEVHLPFIQKGEEVAARLVLGSQDRDHVDFAPTLTDPSTFDALLNDPRVTVVRIPGLNIFYLGFFWDKDDIKKNTLLRKAVVCAIDVNTHASLGKGASAPAIGPVPPNMHGYDPDDPKLHQDQFDPVKAQNFLNAANWERALTLLYNEEAPYSRALATAITTDLQRIGLKVNPRPYHGWQALNAEVKKDLPRVREGDMFLYSWHQRHPHNQDPYDFLEALFHSKRKGGTNLTRYENYGVDANLDQRKNHYDVQTQIINDAPMIFLSHWTRMAAYNVRVQNLQLDSGALPIDKLVRVQL